MKRPIGILIVLLMLALPGFNQNKHRMQVSDALSRKGIPYATVKVLNKPEGTYADSLGQFEVISNVNDSLLLTCVGYHTKLKEIQHDTIFLNPVVVLLG